MCTRWQDEPDLRIAEFEHCYVQLNRDQFFPGYVLVFSKDHVTELFHLSPATRGALIEEVNRVAEALYHAYTPTKINYELLGNMVPHMHWHLIPRFTNDPLWPRPIWSEPHQEQQLSAPEYQETIMQIQGALGVAAGWERP
jgi:diadenosine tetraphosphate (Ap4A) HIT family hydrolase